MHEYCGAETSERLRLRCATSLAASWLACSCIARTNDGTMPERRHGGSAPFRGQGAKLIGLARLDGRGAGAAAALGPPTAAPLWLLLLLLLPLLLQRCTRCSVCLASCRRSEATGAALHVAGAERRCLQAC